MRTARFSPRFRLLCVLFLVLALSAVGICYYLTQRYSKEWNYWKRLSGSEKSLAVELEIERFGHRVFPPSPQPDSYTHVTLEKLEHSMKLGAEWILSMQEPSGRFQYWYDPVLNQFSSKTDDNFLRQSGTSFSLMLVYKMTANLRYFTAARQSISYLLQFKQQLDVDKAYFLFNEKAKLGGISLPMLTMLEMRQLTGTREFDKILNQLANMILFLQEKYQTGQFKSTYVYRGNYEYEKETGWESKIYPGEALYALAKMYLAFEDVRYRHSMDWALEFYSHERWLSQAFLPWTISAFVSLYQQTSESKYSEYAFHLSDRLLKQQNLDSRDAVYGSFHGLPSANTGSYMEALGDAVHLAQLVKDQRRLKLYCERAKMGYRWLLMLQYTESDFTDSGHFEMSIGGFRESLVNPQLRIDNTQHAISSFAKGLQFIFRVHPQQIVK